MIALTSSGQRAYPVPAFLRGCVVLIGTAAGGLKLCATWPEAAAASSEIRTTLESHPRQPVLADTAVADDGQRVLRIEPRADAVDLQRLGVHLAALVEEHRRGIAGSPRPVLPEGCVDEGPVLGRLAVLVRH